MHSVVVGMDVSDALQRMRHGNESHVDTVAEISTRLMQDIHLSIFHLSIVRFRLLSVRKQQHTRSSMHPSPPLLHPRSLLGGSACCGLACEGLATATEEAIVRGERGIHTRSGMI